MANKVYTLFDTETDNLLEINIEENENKNEKLPIELFKEVEAELLDLLFYREDNNELSDDETDGPIDFIRQVLDSVREEFDGVIEEGEKKHFSIFSLKF